ncbi:MAG TPA: alpha/beta hydrolase [Thermoleophilaceae bacterium]|nr:alpha/beta hydrolase [Thermoleophilaceae bacterium]
MSGVAVTPRDRVEAAICVALAKLPLGAQRLLGGTPIRIDGLELHPTSQLLVKLEQLADVPPVESLPVADARAQVGRQAALLTGPKLPLARVEDHSIPGPAGEIRARLYSPFPPPAEGFDSPGDANPSSAAPGGLLVYYHGGGHVIGTLDTHDSACRFLAMHASAGVLSIDYRLAPEHPYPAAVDDSIAALAWASENAKRLGFDPARIAVGGDSAGGNLAAVVALAAKAGEAPLPAFQLLIYPVCDYVEKRRSYELFRDGFLLTAAEMDWFRDHYLPDRDAAHEWRASPLQAPDLSGLPPAYVLTAGFDPLRDEAEEYARALIAAGVPTALRRHDGLLHSFVNQTTLHRGAHDAMLEAAGALRLALAPH